MLLIYRGVSRLSLVETSSCQPWTSVRGAPKPRSPHLRRPTSSAATALFLLGLGGFFILMDIAPARETEKDIFETRLGAPEIAKLDPARARKLQQSDQRPLHVSRLDRQLRKAARHLLDRRAGGIRQSRQLVLRHRALQQRRLDRRRHIETANQRLHGVAGDQATLVEQRYAIAKHLGFFHV